MRHAYEQYGLGVPHGIGEHVRVLTVLQNALEIHAIQCQNILVSLLLSPSPIRLKQAWDGSVRAKWRIRTPVTVDHTCKLSMSVDLLNKAREQWSKFFNQF